MEKTRSEKFLDTRDGILLLQQLEISFLMGLRGLKRIIMLILFPQEAIIKQILFILPKALRVPLGAVNLLFLS